ncbi:MSMEG_0567/Sll0786 family nitrogen starvation N-acetyltransferase [Acinetobacter baumannii]|jgi:putative N-acetyltransferase (TIGR04045 family)|uniref:GNAT family N-acetyltransferase n=1 Tax=Acinetobacter junii TaxID=40215 RepID=A0AAW5REC2_ACIJU|nr:MULTISPECIES: MSMEG_0567/Sll0786 family nitrogen starvation N-acetyltransferase [Acinetobacter]ATO20556.1 GNAT family N-acetyltransferase [Acinetobacter sp. LoGeW2-3]AYX85285.1 GNAT family N-acetyltransferase [Acinetobacter baumannii]MCB5210306.1 GNAT family N-acetyltransferase [Acinetobacter baumannii]MCG5776534.1 GNAT family N-acetyltransferase [Acinetobacter baumannii]MCG5784346.1 GNAT family N-acetyltransferase [Acinetobacter baumannii]
MYLDDDLSQNPWLQAVNQQLKHYLADEFISADIVIKIVSEDWERRQYYRLREATFRDEQQILKEDRDEYDFKAFGIVAIGQMFGEPDRVIGAVRIFPEGKKTWWGGRLCVDPLYRHHRAIGKALINAAVSTAKNLGCRRFLATVQQQNERYFQKLHWHSEQNIQVANIPHVLMQADLAHYPLSNISQAYMQHSYAMQEVV